MPRDSFDVDLPRVAPIRATRRRRLPTPRDLAALDAILVLGAPRVRAELSKLPFAKELERMLARRPAESGTVRVLRIAGAGAPLCIFGAVARDATMFERLLTAGRMTRELEEPAQRRIGVVCVDHDRAGTAGNVEAACAAIWARAYRLPSFKSKGKRRAVATELRVFSAARVDSNGDHRRLSAEAHGNGIVRWLTALPANILTPTRYRHEAARLARAHGWRLRFFGRRALKRLGAGAFLAVTQADDAAAGIVQLSYRPRGVRGAPTVALVGKGVCFDTGGVNLKSHRSMLDMHTDMAGSAVALATLEALTRLEAPFGVDAWLALAENQTGPRAYKPQDVVRAMNGTTVQVIHSDAEGRMLLADTLTLAARSQPQLIVDFATLTSACVTALSERYAGVFTNRPSLRGLLEDAGASSGERVWTFPMDADFDSDLESRVADILQCSVDGKADHILAARFLNRFMPREIAWAHIDLAPAQRSGGLGHITTDITGFGVRYALALLLDGPILRTLARGTPRQR